MERGELLRVEWRERETASEMEAGGRTISAGTGARDRRRSAGYRSTLPFFLHSDAEAHDETGNPTQPPLRFTIILPKCAINKRKKIDKT